MVTPAIRRVGDRLACKCGVCNNTVATCQMLGCGYTAPAREKIAAMQKQGKSDDVIVASFVAERGNSALAAPPAEGFNLLAWTMPFFMIFLGMGAIVLYVKRFRKLVPIPVVPPLDARQREKYQQRIERDMAEFD